MNVSSDLPSKFVEALQVLSLFFCAWPLANALAEVSACRPLTNYVSSTHFKVARTSVCVCVSTFGDSEFDRANYRLLLVNC